jgi:hypothetical protein
MRSIETQIEIAAPAERAWSVLMDFASYPAWNPFITEIAGTPELGQRLRVRVAPPGRKPMTFRPIVVAATRRREFGWRGRMLLPGLFDGEHRFRLEDKGRVCLLHHSERFSGLLLPLMGEALFAATRQGFAAMNAALKSRAEAG